MNYLLHLILQNFFLTFLFIISYLLFAFVSFWRIWNWPLHYFLFFLQFNFSKAFNIAFHSCFKSILVVYKASSFYDAKYPTISKLAFLISNISSIMHIFNIWTPYLLIKRSYAPSSLHLYDFLCNMIKFFKQISEESIIYSSRFCKLLRIYLSNAPKSVIRKLFEIWSVKNNYES